MSFFTRKPNPPVPQVVSNQLNNKGIPAPAPLSVGQAPTTGQAEQNQQSPSNARFRSFAERYVVARCRDWKEGEIDERAWEAIMQARTIYNKVKEVGRTLTNDT